MANEELIYRITRAIYERLGTSADEATVEQLVTDIYQTVAPALSRNGGAAPATSTSVGASFGEAAHEGSVDHFSVRHRPSGDRCRRVADSGRGRLQYRGHQPNCGTGEIRDGDYREHCAFTVVGYGTERAFSQRRRKAGRAYLCSARRFVQCYASDIAILDFGFLICDLPVLDF